MIAGGSLGIGRADVHRAARVRPQREACRCRSPETCRAPARLGWRGSSALRLCIWILTSGRSSDGSVLASACTVAVQAAIVAVAPHQVAQAHPGLAQRIVQDVVQGDRARAFEGDARVQMVAAVLADARQVGDRGDAELVPGARCRRCRRARADAGSAPRRRDDHLRRARAKRRSPPSRYSTPTARPVLDADAVGARAGAHAQVRRPRAGSQIGLAAAMTQAALGVALQIADALVLARRCSRASPGCRPPCRRGGTRRPASLRPNWTMLTGPSLPPRSAGSPCGVGSRSA